MQGVVVDFYTLYDPVALAAVLLSHTAAYKRIYVSKHSFWLEASPASGSGWVPINGFRQFEHGLDHPGVEWSRNWCKNNLKTSEDTIARENLYASILLIQKLKDAGSLRLIPFEETFMEFSQKLLTQRDSAAALTFDSMMPFGEGREDAFYLSPDRGHGLELGIAVIMTAKDDFRFSTNNPLIETTLGEVLAGQSVPPRRHRKLEFNINIPCGPKLAVNDVFRLMENQELCNGSERFRQHIEKFEKDLIYFATRASLDKRSEFVAIRGKIVAHIWERLPYGETKSEVEPADSPSDLLLG